MNKGTQARLLKVANEVAIKAVEEGYHPFGAILVAPDQDTVLVRQGNVNTVQHAEAELARRAYLEYDPDYLWECSLVTTFEPCTMCSGTIYWANIGNVLYGASETELLELTGADPENPTMDLPCRAVFASGQKDIKVYGPVPSLKEALVAPHKEFWNRQ